MASTYTISTGTGRLALNDVTGTYVALQVTADSALNADITIKLQHTADGVNYFDLPSTEKTLVSGGDSVYIESYDYTLDNLYLYINVGSATLGTLDVLPSLKKKEDFNINHNNTSNKQGGTSNEYYHLTESQYDSLVSMTSGNYVIVNSVSDLPAAVSNVITLLDNVTYFFINHLDLVGDRLVSGENTTILGASSENCSITSTGLGTGIALLTSLYTTPIRHINFKDVDTALDFDGVATTMALDWTGVNFSDVPNIGTIKDCANFIFSKGAFLSSEGLLFTGSIATIGIDNSLFVGSGAAKNIIELDASCIITRRFRIIYSSVVAFGSTVGIDVDLSATIPTESFILDTVNFSGGGTYLGGLGVTSNDSLFINCVGIINSAANGQLYMQNNATATTVSVVSTFYKVAGTTTASADNSKFSHSNNRLTCDATISRKYLISCSLSFNSSANNVCEFGFYDSQLATVRTPSRTLATANSAGRAESVSFSCVLEMTSGDYLEIYAANTTGANDITVSDMNFIITDIK